MRQTKGALTLLLAQYKAIYMRALAIGFAGTIAIGALLVPDVTLAAMQAPAQAVAAPSPTEEILKQNFSGVIENNKKYKSESDSEINVKGAITANTDVTNTMFYAKDNSINLKASSVTLKGSVSFKGGNNNKSVKFNLGSADNKRGVFTGDNVGEIILLDQGQLEFTNADVRLDEFKTLKAKYDNTKINLGNNTHTTISEQNLTSYLAPTDTVNNKAGQLVLKGTDATQATLEINNLGADGLVLNKYVGTATNGKISGTGTVKADHIVITDKLHTNQLETAIQAGKLVIGDGKTALNDKINFKSATASDSIEFKSADNAGFNVKDEFTLKALDNAKHTLSGKVNLADANGKLTFTAGNWDIEDDVSLKNGSSFTVKAADANTNVNVNFKDHTLTFTDGGTVDVGGSDGKSSLDLSQATIKGHKDATFNVNAKGDAKVDALGFTELQKGKIDVKKDAVLEIVDGEITLNGTNTAEAPTSTKISIAGTVKGKALAIKDTSGKDASNKEMTLNLADTGSVNFDSIQVDGKSLTADKGTITVGSAFTVNLPPAPPAPAPGPDGPGVPGAKASAAPGAPGVPDAPDAAKEETFTLKVKNLNLGEDKNSNGTITAKSITIEKEGNKTNIYGNWTTNGTDIILKDGTLTLNDGSNLRNVNKLSIEKDKVTTLNNSNLDVKQLDLSGDITVNGGTFTVVGTEIVTPPAKPDPTEPPKPSVRAQGDVQDQDEAATKGDVVVADGAKLVANTNSRVVFGSKTIDDLYDGTKNELTTNGKNLASAYHGNSNAVLELQFDKGTTFTKDQAKELSKQFKNNKGFINLGDASLDVAMQGEQTLQWNDAKDLGSLQITNKDLEKAKVQATDADVSSGIYGSFGSFDVTSTNGTLSNINVGGATILGNAAGNSDGKSFVTVNGKTADLTLKDNAALTLANGGDIGKITSNGGNNAIGVIGNGTTNIDSINANNADVSFSDGRTNIKNDLTAKSITANNTSLDLGGNTKVNNFDLTNTNANFKDLSIDLENGKDASILGGSVKAQKLTLKEQAGTAAGTVTPNLTIANNANVSLDSLTASNAQIDLGYKEPVVAPVAPVATFRSALAAAIDDSAQDKNTSKNSFAHLYVKDSSAFTGNVDLESGVANASIMAFGDSANKANQNVNLSGNTIVAYGVDSSEHVERLLKDNYIQNSDGSIKGNKAVAVFNKATTVDGKITLNAATPTTTPTTGGTLHLGDNSTIVITNDAVSNGQTAVTIKGGNLTIEPQGSQSIELVGITAFDNSKGDTVDIAIFDKDTANKSQNELKNVAVTGANGQLIGQLNADGKLVSFNVVNDKVHANNTAASAPVRDYIADVLGSQNTKEQFKPGYKGQLTAADREIQNIATNLTSGNTIDKGRAIEQASRFAAYGQTVKTTELAVNDFSNVLQNFLTNDGSIVRSDDFEGISLFASPSYNKASVSSLDMQGVEAGGDVDLTNLVVGANFDLNYKLKLGAMLSIGTASSSGDGTASGLSADSDVYGGSLYASYADKGLQVSADLTHVMTKSKIESNLPNFNQFSADVDTTATSVGANAAYVLLLDKGSYLKPHAGVRYTKYHIKDYDVQSNGVGFMQNSFESAQVLSVPIGLVLGTEIKQRGYVIKPTLDLGVTFNTGDTDVNSVATLNTQNKGVSLTSEIVDSVVFGLKANVNAQFQNNLTLGVGLGYQQGSSSKDLGVNAGFNYRF